MKTLITAVSLLCIASAAAADVTTVKDGWTVTYHISGEPLTHFYGNGTYLFLLQGTGPGVVYLQQDGWRYLGSLEEVELPAGFPEISYDLGGLDVQVAVTPPAPAPKKGGRRAR